MARLDTSATEWRTTVSADSGRAIRQYTSARAHSYPLYYFVPSITAEGSYLVFHSERSGTVQLYRLDLVDGSIVQLTEGATADCGWAIWCAYHVDGIYNHLSALEVRSADVYYFDRDEIRAVNVRTCADRLVRTIPGRVPIGQSAFAPDGRLFAFVDADADVFSHAYAEREARERAGTFAWSEHDEWRRTVPSRICVVDTATGDLRVVRELDFHVHHVLFVDNETLLVNHDRHGNGMWTVRVDGSEIHSLRPTDAHGSVCHQVVVDGGVLYETSMPTGDETWFGRFRFATNTWKEWRLPAGIGYVHTGNDPDGRLLFIEACARDTHALYLVRPRSGEDVADAVLLQSLNSDVYDRLDQQRHHAHPFLDRSGQLFYTDVIDEFSQICSLDVSDLTIG